MLKRLRLLLALALLAGFPLPAHATQTSSQVFKGTVISAQVASANYASAWIDTGNANAGSVQCKWASLTGTLDGQFSVETSNDKGVTATSKSGATITVSGASGDSEISLNGGTVTESAYRIKWTKNNVTGGTINCYVTFKG